MTKTLLDCEYVIENSGTAINLFYKEDGKRTIRRINDFVPYFYAVLEEDADLEELKKSLTENYKQIRGIEEKKMNGVADKSRVIMIKVATPMDVRDIRTQILQTKGVSDVREADIPFVRRYLIDTNIIPMENAENAGLNIASFDIEVDNRYGEPKSERDPIIMISYANQKGYAKVWTYRKPRRDMNFVEIVKDEEQMIKKFIERIGTDEIDIITSYNGDNFDFPYIITRAEKYGMKVSIGIDGSEIKSERRGMNMGMRIRGRPHVDMFPVCRQAFNLPRYTLENVYEYMFGEKKEDVDGMEIYKYWEEYQKNSEMYKTLLEYSLSDVVSTLKISIRMLPLVYEMSRVVGVIPYEVARMSSGQRVEELLIRYAHKKNILVPNKPREDTSSMRGYTTFKGAYVVEPKRGIHDNIVLFDFRSLYPSIIISHNVDPSTINCTCCTENGYRTPDIDGTRYRFCKDKKGFIPEILEHLIKKRIEVKDLMKRENDPVKKGMLDVKQHALKILANSFYGYLGFAYARWYSKECAESITAWGREYIQMVATRAENNGFVVLYGDTDSVFITMTGESIAKIKEEAMKFLKSLNKDLPGSMEMELEGVYPTGIFITKKRYALLGEDGKITIKGLEVRRRDWANIAKEAQKKVLDAILRDKNPEKAAEMVKKIVNDIKDGAVAKEDLIINTKLTKKISKYLSVEPHISATKKALKRGIKIDEGDIIPYIITKKGASISEKAEIADFVGEKEYDPEYYINNQVIPAVMRIMEALGYTEDELKGLSKQMTLGSF